MPTSGILVVPTWDLIVIVGFIFFIVYSLILQKEKILTSLVAVYISIVVTQTLGDKVAAFFMGNNFIGNFWIKANLSPFWVKIGLFFLIIIIFAIRSDLVVSMKKDISSSLLLNLLYSMSYATLLVSSILNFLPGPLQNSFIIQSRLANFLFLHQTWWVILPVILLIAGGYLNRNKSGSE
jgi:hypothetical protein